MSQPKLHHYVPQFHLRRFMNVSGHLWLWDRDQDRTFSAKPRNVAAENSFYWLADLAEQGHDPLTMEKQLADLEGSSALITGQWIDYIRQMASEKRLVIFDEDRDIMSLYIATQFLRTADTRNTIAALYTKSENKTSVSNDEARKLHTHLMWDEESFQKLASRVYEAIWVFGHNTTDTPFVTSDNPVTFRTRDHAMWLKAEIYSSGTYIVFALTPDIVMYCFPREPPFERVIQFDCTISPVVFTQGMVNDENTGQVFMASRFVISSCNDFENVRNFARTIGTNIFARGRSHEP